MKSRKSLALVFSVAALLAGCGGNGGGGSAAATRFDDFVIDIVQNGTLDSAEPVEVNGKTFRFDEDPAAYDSLFQ